MSSPSLGPPARPKAFLLGSSPPKARKPEARTSLTKTPTILGSCMYINTRLPARPKQILHYPNPPEARNLKKRQARVRPKPKNLRLAHHYSSSQNLAESSLLGLEYVLLLIAHFIASTIKSDSCSMTS